MKRTQHSPTFLPSCFSSLPSSSVRVSSLWLPFSFVFEAFSGAVAAFLPQG